MSTDFSREFDPSAVEKIRPTGQDFELWVPPRYRHHYVERSYEAFSARLLANVAHSRDLFVDVGAHVGFYTVLFARTRPGVPALAVEPVPETFAVLRKNLELNGLDRVEALEAAVSDEAGRRTFQIAAASDSCGFYPHDQAPALSTLEVRTETLTALLGRFPQARRPLIKIDAEGHEPAVLEGLAGALGGLEDVRLFLEINPAMLGAADTSPESLLEKLQSWGLTPYLLDEGRGQASRIEDFFRYRELIGERGYANVYAAPRETTRSVCFFSHSAKLEGAERNLLELVTELIRDHGDPCTVVLPEDGPLGARLEEVGAAVVEIPYGWWCDLAAADRGAAYRLLNSLRAVLGRGLEQLERINPDALVTLTMVIPWGAVAAACLSKPHIWFVSEYGELDHRLKFFFPFERILTTIERSSQHIFTVSKAVAQTLFPHLDETLCSPLYPYLELPPDLRSEKLSETPETGGGELPYRRPGAVRLGVFGAVNPTKSQETAVEAVRELVQRGHDVELLLAGHPNRVYLAALEARIRAEGLEEHVRVPGFLEDVLPVMAATDVVVVCSQREAFGRVAVEAARLGKPVVCPDTGGIVEAVEDGVTARVYPVGDAGALADRLEELITDPQRRRRMGEAGRRLAQRTFTREAFGGRLHTAVLALGKQPPPFPPQLSPLIPVLLAHLEASLADLEQGARGERESSHRYVTRLEDEVGAVRLQLSEVGAYVTHLETELAAQREENERCRDYAVHLEGALVQSRHEPAAGTEEDDAAGVFRRHVERLESVLEERRAQHERDREHIERLELHLEELRATRDGDRERIADLEEELGRKPSWDELARQEAELAQLRGSWEEASRYSRELEATLQAQQQNEERAREHIAKLERELAGHRREQQRANENRVHLEHRLAVWSTGRPRITAVTVHHAGADLLDRCLTSLLASLEVELSVVVVDNACPEPLPAVVGEASIHVVRSEEPIGFSAANNLGVAWAEEHLGEPDLYFFVNNDTVTPPETLLTLAGELALHPECGIVGPRLMIWHAEGHLNSLGLNVTRVGEAWDEGIGIHLDDYGPLPPRREVLAVTGSALLIRAAALEQIRGWTELYGYYYEDIDLCLKARRRGWTVRHVPDAVVEHAVSATADRIPDFKRMLSWRNQMVLLALHWPWRLAPRVIPYLLGRELGTLWRRWRLGARDDARLQLESWRGALALLPRAWRERWRNGRVTDWASRLLPPGSVPVIRLPRPPEPSPHEPPSGPPSEPPDEPPAEPPSDAR
jgi:FkbM family methyltransferase